MQSDPLFMVFGVVILIISIVIHEVAHGYAANSLGDPTAKLLGRLTLNPIKHVDPIGSILIPAFLVLTHAGILFGWAKPVPYNPYNLRNQRWGEAVVASAGALTNILLAVIFGLIARFGFEELPDTFVTLALTASFTNLFLGLFNLIPLPPLDGYTVLRTALPFKAGMALRDFEDKVRSFGIGGLIVILLMFSYFFAGPFSYFVQRLFAMLVG